MQFHWVMPCIESMLSICTDPLAPLLLLLWLNYTVQQFPGSKIIQKRHIVVLIGFCALIPNLGSKLKSYERFSHNSRKNRGKSIFCGFSYKKYKETRYRHSDFFNWKNIILGSYCKRKNEKKLKIGLLAEF